MGLMRNCPIHKLTLTSVAMPSRQKTTMRRTTTYSTARRQRYNEARADGAPFSLRRWLVLGGAALLLLALLLWYMLNGGWARAEQGLYDFSAAAGLRVEEVFISGRTYLDRDELLASIGVERGDAILALDLPAIHARIMANAWVDSARVERHLPNVLYITLIERKPFALWQHNQKLHLIDAEGVVLSTNSDEIARFATLPLVVGAGAAPAASAMLATLRDYPELRASLTALVRISERRWDLRLQNGLTLKLPETNEVAALDRVQAMWQAADLQAKGVRVIDARLPDRLILDNINSEQE